MYSRLQFISFGSTADEQLSGVSKALDSGCKWIQFRMKTENRELLLSTGKEVRERCKEFNATFIVNDHVEIATELNADGIHLGLDDMAVQEARAILGEDKIIGGTANTLEHVQQRISEGCNYIGLGPYRFTKTKKALSPILGVEGYEAITRSTNQSTVPVYAIGGIEVKDVAPIKKAGVYGIAVSGAILKGTENIVEQFNNELYE